VNGSSSLLYSTFLILSLPSLAYAQEDLCSDILRVGVHNHFQNVKYSELSSIMWKWACSSSFASAKDEFSYGIDVVVEGIPIGQNLTKSSLDEWQKQNCSEDQRKFNTSSFESTMRSVLDRGAVDAWRSCMNDRVENPVVATRLSYLEPRVFRIRLSWNPNKLSLKAPVIESVSLHNAQCEYSEPGTSVVSVMKKGANLERDIEQICRRVNDGIVEISIQTSAGVVRPAIRLPPIPAPSQISSVKNKDYVKPYRFDEIVSEMGTATVKCPEGTAISTYQSIFADNVNCRHTCGGCQVGAKQCSVTYSTGSCGDCAHGVPKSGHLFGECTAVRPYNCAQVCRDFGGRCNPEECIEYRPECKCAK
jgi:hypothetical protein